MIKRIQKIKKRIKQEIEQDEQEEKKKKKEEELSEFAMTPFGIKYKFKGDEKTFMMFSHKRRGYFF